MSLSVTWRNLNHANVIILGHMRIFGLGAKNQHYREFVHTDMIYYSSVLDDEVYYTSLHLSFWQDFDIVRS